jgi:hypothetical protein
MILSYLPITDEHREMQKQQHVVSLYKLDELEQGAFYKLAKEGSYIKVPKINLKFYFIFPVFLKLILDLLKTDDLTGNNSIVQKSDISVHGNEVSRPISSFTSSTGFQQQPPKSDKDESCDQSNESGISRTISAFTSSSGFQSQSQSLNSAKEGSREQLVQVKPSENVFKRFHKMRLTDM